LKLACTLVSPAIVRLYVTAVPEQAPLHPVKLSPTAGVAVSVTVAPCWNFAEQLFPQLMEVENSPLGVPVTDPLPLRPIERALTVVNVAVAVNER
jgi:hypothetical protein